MKKHMRIFSCALALIMMTAGLAGQAPADLVKEIEWQDLTFNKAIVSASFSQGPAAAKNMLDLGAAFKAGSVYVGSYYKGNLGSYTGKEEQNVTTALTQAGGIITNTQTELTP